MFLGDSVRVWRNGRNPGFRAKTRQIKLLALTTMEIYGDISVSVEISGRLVRDYTLRYDETGDVVEEARPQRGEGRAAAGGANRGVPLANMAGLEDFLLALNNTTQGLQQQAMLLNAHCRRLESAVNLQREENTRLEEQVNTLEQSIGDFNHQTGRLEQTASMLEEGWA
eukprot:g17727.t1